MKLQRPASNRPIELDDIVESNVASMVMFLTKMEMGCF